MFRLPTPPSANNYPNAHATQTGLPTCAGIYRIVNLGNGHFYIGSTNNLSKRWRDHRDKLRLSKHPNRHLQSAWNKYGESSFEYQVLEIIMPDVLALVDAEQRWLDRTKAAERPDCYNMMPLARRTEGIKRSPETCQRISASNKGRIPSKETREKMRRAKLGRCLSDSHKAKLSAAFTGRKMGPMSDERKRFYRKLNDVQLAEFRRLRGLGWSPKHLSEQFGIGKSTCWRIISGESYRG